MRKLFKLALLLILSTAQNLYSQSRVSAEKDSDKSSQQYQIIDEPEVRSFLGRGLSYAIELYGEPRISVREVTLRYKPQGSPYTNLTDSKKGRFTIYLTHRPNEYAFYGQLAHEIAHLLNAQLYDMYVEGLNTFFSERLLKESGKDWSGWERYYEENEEPFYASTYFMMKEVSEVGGDEALRSFLSHAKYNSGDSQKMYIDIKEWLNSLPRESRDQVRSVILKHAAAVQKAMNGKRERYAFMLPQ